METVTDNQITALQAEARTHGDPEMAAICARALDGDAAARQDCAEVIADARARRDDRPDHAETIEEEAERETTPALSPLNVPETLASIADSGADAYRRGYGCNRSAFAWRADAGQPDGGTYE